MIQYTCCLCGATMSATYADVENAHAASRVDPDPNKPLAYTDRDVFFYYGRDICPDCTPRYVSREQRHIDQGLNVGFAGPLVNLPSSRSLA